MLVRHGAHQADRHTIRILEDGIACAPEGVVRWHQSGMASAGHLSIEPIDGVARGNTKADDDFPPQITPPLPALVPDGGKRRTVEVERRPHRLLVSAGVGMVCSRSRLPHLIIGKIDTETAIKRYRGIEIAAYDIDLIELRSLLGHRRIMTTNLLQGERALVTGCAGGIGRAIAKALKAEGAAVLGSDIAAPPAEDGIDFLAADLSRRDGWKALLDGALTHLDSISLLVHAASPRRQEIDTPLSVSEETWDAMLDINLRSGFFLAREVGRHMRDNHVKGRILLITSMHRLTPRNLPHYSAAKAGMTMAMKELARALAPAGIRVNALAPGAIPGGGFVADDLGSLVAQIPLGRAGTPDDIAEMAVALLSERFGRYVVGTTVEVDGGLGLLSWIPSKA